MLAAQVASGGGGMPSFSGSLSSSEIQQLADWVSSAAGGGSGSASRAATSPTRACRSSAVRKSPSTKYSTSLGFFNGPFTGFYRPPHHDRRPSGSSAPTASTPTGVWGPLSQAARVHALRARH